MNDFKQASGVLRFVGGLAGLVFLLAPITTKHGLEIGGVALLVFILCVVVDARTKRDALPIQETK